MKPIEITVDAGAAARQHHKALLALGYRRGAPKSAYMNDKVICAGATCSHCGHQGLEYHPYYRFEQGSISYRAFAVCPACHLEEEF
ncbi:MAG: hypothetical protein KatS3mg051_2203 [Anaerolineae bacterium]|nr:MAG: hypothetical protein KatS3mg051_2203 [Anaerolineae bacterium]